MTELDFQAAIPIGFLVAVALAMLVADMFGKCTMRNLWGTLACVGAALMSWCYRDSIGPAFQGMVYVDAFTWLFNMIILGGTWVSLLFGGRLLAKQQAESSVDVDVLMMLASAGAMVMVASGHLIVLFVGFELLSISVYALTGLARRERASSEAALKYFLLGAFSSAFLIYGMTLIYAATGSMHLLDIAIAAESNNVLLLVGMALMIFGFGFKVSLVPFHVWTPDVYQGAPVSITTFMAVVVKAAAFGGFLRLMYVGFGTIASSWIGLIWVLAVVSMTVGNLVALRQQSIKRMLAYSSIAHAGYALMGFVAFGAPHGAEATIFYLLVYSLMTILAFGVVLFATADTDAQYSKDSIDSLSGLGWSHPFLGIIMTVAMLSLAGIPPLAGFMGKLYLFKAAIDGKFVGLAIIAALNSVVSLYYYLRVLVVMYFKTDSPADIQTRIPIPWASQLALVVVTFLTVYFGIFSEVGLTAVQLAVQSLGLFVALL